MTDYLCTIPDLERVVGERPAAGHLKSIRFLDDHCDTLLAVSTFSIVAVFGADGTPRTMAVGGPAGHLTPIDARRLSLGDLELDATDLGASIGLLSFIPGYRETLRVNGRVGLVDAAPVIEVEEAFLHCAKALIRSRLWDDAPAPSSDDAVTTSVTSTLDEVSRAFFSRSPLLTLSSMDGNGEADVSPKGDPAGFVHVLDDVTIAIPDRPGNHRTDTMHNLVDHPRIGLLAFVPGDPRTLELRGTARITDDAAIRGLMAIEGKTPAAAVVVDVDHVEVRRDPAIEAAALWDASRHVVAGSLPRGATIWTDHVKLNDDPGPDNELMRSLVDEEMLGAGIDHDYETNLY